TVLPDFLGARTLIPGKDLTMLCLDQEGNFYKTDENGQEQLIFRNDGSQIGRGCFAYEYEDDILSLWDTEAEKGYQISTEGHGGSIISGAPRKLYSGYWNRISEDGRKILETGVDENLVVIDRVKWSREHQTERWLELSGQMIASVFIYLLLIYLLSRKKAGMPVWGYLVLIIVPFIIIGQGLLFRVIDKHMELTYDRNQAVQLAQVSRNYKMRLDMDKFEEYASYPALTAEQNAELLIPVDDFLIRYRTGEEGEEEEGSEKWISQSIPEVFRYKDGIFTGAGTYSYQLNLSIEYQCDAEMLKAMTTAVEEHRDIYLSFDKSEGEWGRKALTGSGSSKCVAVFSPIEGADGNVIGILETMADSAMSMRQNIISKQRIKNFIRWITLVLLLTVLVITYWNMKPLRMLSRAVFALTEGRLTSRIKEKGNSEVTALSTVFNRIAGTAQTQVQQMEAYQKRYEAFLPERLFQLLNKRGIQSVAPGDVRKVSGALLALDICEVERKEDFDTIDHVNASLAVQVPVIQAGGGIIFRFLNAGTESIFVGEERKNILSTAVSVIQQGRRIFENGRFCAGITESILNLGIIGSDKRSRIAVLAQQKEFAWFLQQLAKECGSTVLLTAKAAESIVDFRVGYHYRMLGYVYMREKEELELIYEILDGDRDEERRKKMLTKELFESGVGAFMTNQMSEARRCFIKVVDQDKEDRAAIKYIHLCENYLEKRQGQEVLCLEIY
ncbi:MAG: hypothetical protein RR466_01140, partial [Hungatella sp.]